MNNYYFLFNSLSNDLLTVCEDEASVDEVIHNSDVPIDIVFCDGTMDSLDAMFLLQDFFQARLGAEFDTQYIMDHVLYAEAEMHEMLRELEGFKAWKKYDWSEGEKQRHLERARDEYIDVLHFVLNIGLALGVDTAQDVLERFAEKNAENHARQDRGY